MMMTNNPVPTGPIEREPEVYQGLSVVARLPSPRLLYEPGRSD